MAPSHFKLRIIAASMTILLVPMVIALFLANIPAAHSQAGTSPILIESDNPIVEQQGQWTAQQSENASGGRYLFSSDDTGDTLTLNFEGTRVEIIFVQHESFGGFAIEIDNIVRRTVVANNAETSFDNRAVIDYLEAGKHTLRVYPVEGVIGIDAFITSPNSGTPLPESSPQQTISLSGELSFIYGDLQDGTNDQFIVSLNHSEDGKIADLVLDHPIAHEYSGQNVTVVGNVESTVPTESATVPLVNVSSIQLANSPTEAAGPVELAGSQPFVNVLCRFPDIGTTPHNPEDYASLFDTSYPGLDHYWRQISYNNINIVGTTTVDQWYVLPQNRSYYVSGSSVNLDAIANDCVASADADVFFPDYVGINLMLNSDIGCCAWGGYKYMSVDGQNKMFRMTWMPPWSQEHDTMGHEMGHAFGLPHSSGPSDNVPAYIYVSNWDVMSRGGGTCANTDATWGCLATGTISDYVDLDAWIPTERRTTVNTGSETTVTLERLNLPVSGTNDLIAIVPINGSNTHYYTVEARFKDSGGYDQNIPGNAVIIHDVLTSRTGNSGPALVVDANDGNDNINDAGAMWTSGETYYDAANNITITVQSAGSSSFTVFINNNYVKPPESGLPNGDIYLESPTFTWTDTTNAEWFNVRIETGSNIQVFSQWYQKNVSVNCPANNCSVKINAALPDGTYNWYIRSWKSAGGFSSWDGPTAFSIVDASLTSPTSTTLTIPSNVTFIWGEITVPDVEWYKLLISGPGGYQYQQWFDGSICTASVCTATPNVILPTNGQYTWYVKGWGSDGYGPWSDPLSFTLDVAAPDSPDGLVETLTNGIPTLYEWSDDDTVSWFRLWVSGPSGIIHNQWYQKGNSALSCSGTCSINPPLNYVDGEYQWYVQAYGPGGNIWSADGGDFIINLGLPDTPDGLIETMTDGIPTDYEWNDDIRVTWFKLWVSGPSGIIHNQWYQKGNSALSCSGTCSINPPLSYTNGDYMWYVQAYGPGGSIWSADGRNFTVNLGLPDTPDGLAKTMTDGIPTTYKWNDNPNTTWFNLWVSGPSGVILNKWYQKGHSSMICSGTCSVNPTLAYTNGNYTWYVRAYSPAGTRWSDGEDFTISIGTPLASTLISPANNIISSNATIQFQWNPVTIATWYQVELQDSKGINVVSQWFASSVCTNGTCTAQLNVPSTAASWRIRTYGTVGYGQWSTSRNITILN